ncbi:hypothetical protein [Duganella violaceipulchra]|uniref:Uncharacterized protein n=1 Tax=Duganella violaceipulchra TaxID=2849652 RepID=A0AA41HGK8_9BURK|nr:hypothetical protein [Duganella violaceicalia]MBV6324722.1 hypothetical protein [Duganella violaceicalia]MCP2009045.1 hypothetical protein [Duganella violaceicalia]
MASILIVSSAWADDVKKDAYLDAVVAPAAVKAMEGHVDPALRKAVAEAMAAEIPPQSLPREVAVFGGGASRSSDIMTAAFKEAKVPDCLHSEGLKRQPTFFLTGILALPFIPIAKLRGKCI